MYCCWELAFFLVCLKFGFLFNNCSVYACMCVHVYACACISLKSSQMEVKLKHTGNGVSWKTITRTSKQTTYSVWIQLVTEVNQSNFLIICNQDFAWKKTANWHTSIVTACSCMYEYDSLLCLTFTLCAHTAVTCTQMLTEFHSHQPAETFQHIAITLVYQKQD